MPPSLLSRLWQNIRAALTGFRSRLHRLDTYTSHERRGLRRWLKAVEAHVRRTVLLEALSLKERGSSDPQGSVKRNAGLRTRSPKAPCLRLWPRKAPTSARIRQLGPPVLARDIWREQHRAALSARLQVARQHRRRPFVRIADRIDALEKILAAPLRAARRLAPKLTRRVMSWIALAPVRSALGLDDRLQSEGQGALVPFLMNSS